MECTGRGDANGEHCCFVDGERCRFLEENVGGRRWVCGLRRELGSWDAVHEDARYLASVQPAWDRVGIESCGSWGPGTGQCCYTEVGN